LELFHVSHGAGPPVIALHGYCATHFTWRHLVAPLARERELILFDLLGHGRSPKPDDGKYSLRDQAALLHDYVRARDLERITLIGQSMGGGIALLLAERLLAERPARLAALVLIASVCFPQRIALLGKIPALAYLGELVLSQFSPRLLARLSLLPAFHDRRKITADMIEAGAANFADRESIRAILATAPHVIPPDMEPALDAIYTARIPVLLLWGRQDLVVPLKLGKRLNVHLRHSHLHVIESCGHIPHEEAPERAVPAIVEFVARNACPSPASEA
jgi:pimeloyl-ACP methyl ester carboxylesterase